MKIGVDVDGVLADFGRAHRKMVLQVTGIDLKGLEPTDWEHTNYGLTKEQSADVWKAIGNTENFWLSLGSLDGVERLRRFCEQHEVTFITNRAVTKGMPIRQQTAEWLKTYFALYNPMVIVAKNKGEVAKALKLDVFIDDNVDNCRDLVAHGIKTYLVDASYNQECGNEFPRVEDFDEFASILTTPQPQVATLSTASAMYSGSYPLLSSR